MFFAKPKPPTVRHDIRADQLASGMKISLSGWRLVVDSIKNYGERTQITAHNPTNGTTWVESVPADRRFWQ